MDRKTYIAEWRKAHKEQLAQYDAQYYLAHREKIIVDKTVYAQTHRKEIRDYQREYQPIYKAEHGIEVQARHAAVYHIPTIECERCGSDKDLQRHHPDYSKSLEVVVLCRACHFKEHREVKNGKLHVV